MSSSDWISSPNENAQAEETAQKVTALIEAEAKKAESTSHLQIKSIGTPNWSDVPEPMRSELQDIGFRPVATIAVTASNIEVETAPNFIGPDGYTKFQTTRAGWMINTIMDDGHALYIQTGLPSSLPNMTCEQAQESVEASYRQHLRTVQIYADFHGRAPLQRPDADSIVRVWRLFYIYQSNANVVPMIMVALALVFLVAGAVMVILL